MFVHVDKKKKKKLLLDFDHFLCCVFTSLGIIHVRIVVGLFHFIIQILYPAYVSLDFPLWLIMMRANVRDRIYILLSVLLYTRTQQSILNQVWWKQLSVNNWNLNEHCKPHVVEKNKSHSVNNNIVYLLKLKRKLKYNLIYLSIFKVVFILISWLLYFWPNFYNQKFYSYWNSKYWKIRLVIGRQW